MIHTLYCWVLSKEASSTIFRAFGMTRPGLNPGLPNHRRSIYPLGQWAGMYKYTFPKYYWNLKDRGFTSQMNGKIIKKSSSTSSLNIKGNLCREERIFILKYKDTKNLSNKRNELIFKCRHRNRFKLKWYVILSLYISPWWINWINSNYNTYF